MKLTNEYIVTMLTDGGKQVFSIIADTLEEAEDASAKKVEGDYAEVVAIRKVAIGGSK
jgi:hypothetical protein